MRLRDPGEAARTTRTSRPRSITSHWGCGNRASATRPLSRALAISEKQLRSDHPRVATTLNNFALVLEAQGEYAAAEPLSRRNRAMFEKQLVPDHQ